MRSAPTSIAILTLAAVLALGAAGSAAARDGHAGIAGLSGASLPAAAPAPDLPLAAVNWIEHFDLYATGSQMHGQGGWKGWGNSAAAGALTSSGQARSVANSVAIVGSTDLVHEYSGYAAGVWTYTAWQYIPVGFSGISYFIMLNRYADADCTTVPTGPGCNWSTEVLFDATLGTLGSDLGACMGPTLPFVTGQWSEIRVVIDLGADTQTFYYNGTQLYSCSWSEGGSTGGSVNIAAVDLFANTGSTVYYDDISLTNLPFLDGFEAGDTREWSQTAP